MHATFRHLLVTMIASLAWSASAEEFTLTPPAPEIIAQDAGDVMATDTIVVIAPDAATATRLAETAAGAGYVLRAEDPLSGIGLIMQTYGIPGTVTPLNAIQQLEGFEPDTTAGVNHAYRSGQSSLPADPRSYAGALIGWPREGCVAQVPVGIIDGARPSVMPLGLDADAIVHQSFAPGANAADHASAIAALLGGEGRLRDARLYHASVVGAVAGKSPAAGVDAILRAVDWLAGNGVRLVNVSLAGPYNKILDRGLQAAARKGMILVAAAGNDGPEAPPRYPAAFSYIIAVTAVDAAMRAYDKAPEGTHIDVAAPGVDVFIQAGEKGRYISGTSIAAPFVTAALAADPKVTTLGSVDEVRAWLASQSKDLGAPGPDPLFGMGLIQAGPGCG